MAIEKLPIISRSVLFGNPDHMGVRVSPNKAYLSYIAPMNGVLNIWVAPLHDVQKARCITHDTNRGIRSYSWAQDNAHILFAQDKDGDENWHIYAVDLQTEIVRDLTPYENVHASIAHMSALKPHVFLASVNRRRQDFHDLYEIEIATGKSRVIYENNEFVDLITDDEFVVRFASAPTAEGGAILYRLVTSALSVEPVMEKFLEIGEPDFLTTNPLGLSKDNKHLYMSYSLGRNTSALASVDIETKQVTILGEDSKADFSDALIHPTEKNIQAFASTYERKTWKVLDDTIAEDLKYLRSLAQGELEIISRSLDDTVWIACFLRDVGAPHYYLYERTKKKTQFLFSGRESLDDLPLAEMTPVIIPSRDGQSLVSYVTLPHDVSTIKPGVPTSPLPMVLLVHGGPWARDSWGYDSIHQWLSNRGYAVLSVNFRGSTGFGKNFINLSHGQWGAKMHDDLMDAVNWAIDEGIAKKEYIAIMGGSYGGYASLVALTMTPDAFACGVDIVGPSNLVTLLRSIPEYWKPIYDSLVKRIGADPDTPEGLAFLNNRSPLSHVEQIKKPLLIGQGANDPRVKIAESDQIVEAMKVKHIPVEYVVYPDEGHGFVKPDNRMSFYAMTEVFLAKYLGGRVEPLGAEVENSSMKIMAGELLLDAIQSQKKVVH